MRPSSYRPPKLRIIDDFSMKSWNPHSHIPFFICSYGFCRPIHLSLFFLYSLHSHPHSSMGFLSCNADSAIATCDPHYWHLKNQNKNKKTTTTKKTTLIRQFRHTDLLAATGNFSAESFLGKGSHGRVYKASLDGGNLVAAVKTTKLSATTASSHNCTTSPTENEIEILSQIQSHRLVNLIGFCNDQNDNKLIVVEYMPNGSLHDLLHSTTKPPGWTRRIRFAIQIAKAVHELHYSNPPVIHRDIKSSNVLIDEEWNARLGDFGLALRGHVEDVRVKCTPPAGTLGYLDPCYLAPEDLSAKSDVFSFGILLLEIISGRNAIDVSFSPPSVVDWAIPMIKRGDFAGICDRRVGTPSDTEVIKQLAVLAARCVRSTAVKRPSMAEVVECLKLARKRIRASRKWWRIGRRVAREESARWDVHDCDMSEEVVRVMKGGSNRRNRNNRKVSSVSGVEYEGEPSGKVTRSKSVGRGSNENPNRNEYGSGRRKGRMGVTRLKKSKSTGVLLVLHYGNERKGCE